MDKAIRRMAERRAMNEARCDTAAAAASSGGCFTTVRQRLSKGQDEGKEGVRQEQRYRDDG